MNKETDVLTVHEIGKDGSETVKKYKINDDGTLGKKLSSCKKALRHARENAMTILPNGQCVPYAVFNGGCNDNITVLAASGGGKTRTFVEPNILAGASSMIISDPKGYLYKKYANTLNNEGFDVKHLDTIHPPESIRYNPLNHLGSYNDILKLATMMVYLNVRNDSRADPFWDKAAVLLLCAVIGLIYEDDTDKVKPFSRISEILRTIDANAMAEGERCAFDCLFEKHNRNYRVKHNGKECWAFEQYQKFLGLGRRTLSSVVITIQAYLGSLDTPEIRDMTEYDEMDMQSIGQKKTAVFIEVSDTDRSKDLLVNMFYSQAMQELCAYADAQDNNRLPIPVRFILDDFGTTSKIEGFEGMISNIRSRGISAMLMIQSIAQLEQNYGLGYKTVLNNCDTTIYLGGNNFETAQYISQLVNKTPHSVLAMPMRKCWIFRRGGTAFMADTVDIDCYQKPLQHTQTDKEAV